MSAAEAFSDLLGQRLARCLSQVLAIIVVTKDEAGLGADFFQRLPSGVADGHLPLPPALVDVGGDVDEALSLDVVLGTLRAEMVEGRRLVSYCMRNRDWIGYGFTFLDVLSFGRRVRSAFVCSGLRSSALIRLR